MIIYMYFMVDIWFVISILIVMTQPIIPSHKMNIDSIWVKNLYAGMPEFRSRLLSCRMMFAAMIAEWVFQSDIFSKIKECLIWFQQYELDCETKQSYFNLHKPDLLTRSMCRHVLSDVYRKPYTTKRWNISSNKLNHHHIISNAWFAIDSEMLDICYVAKNSDWATFVLTHPVKTALLWSKIVWVNDSRNIRTMTQNRHNKWLNNRYPGNMLPHHQLLAEMDRTELKLIQQYKKHYLPLDELYALLHSSLFEEIYHSESYNIVTNEI